MVFCLKILSYYKLFNKLGLVKVDLIGWDWMRWFGHGFMAVGIVSGFRFEEMNRGSLATRIQKTKEERNQAEK